MNERLILVPNDFTKVSEVAINHAVTIAKAEKSQIMMLHVVPKADMLEEARQKLQLAKQRVFEQYNFDINVTARIGTIFEDIGELAEELDATLVVMGTHGLRGFQFLTGSRALRIVTSARIPFIIVQERPIRVSGYDDIVVPLDLHLETKQKLNYVADVAKYFQSKVHIIIPGETDEYLRNKVIRNQKYAEHFFEELGIPYTSMISKEKSDDFDHAIIEYAQEIDADLIAIMNLPGSSLSNIIGGNYVQNIITNEAHIPALLVNPKKVSNTSIFGAYIPGGPA